MKTKLFVFTCISGIDLVQSSLARQKQVSNESVKTAEETKAQDSGTKKKCSQPCLYPVGYANKDLSVFQLFVRIFVIRQRAYGYVNNQDTFVLDAYSALHLHVYMPSVMASMCIDTRQYLPQGRSLCSGMPVVMTYALYYLSDTIVPNGYLNRCDLDTT